VVVSKFKRMSRDGRAQDATGFVGYRAPYAVHVNYNYGANFKVGRAGFMTDVAREEMPAMARIASGMLRAGATMRQRIVAMLEHLKTVSQANCPADTGFLRSSAFVRIK
jgi:hypothetical protein